MSYKTRMQSNNESLQTALETVNGLGPGRTFGVCTVTFEARNGSSMVEYGYMEVAEDGLHARSIQPDTSVKSVTVNNVLCGSAVYIQGDSTVTDGGYTAANYPTGLGRLKAYKLFSYVAPGGQGEAMTVYVTA